LMDTEVSGNDSIASRAMDNNCITQAQGSQERQLMQSRAEARRIFEYPQIVL